MKPMERAKKLASFAINDMYMYFDNLWKNLNEIFCSVFSAATCKQIAKGTCMLLLMILGISYIVLCFELLIWSNKVFPSMVTDIDGTYDAFQYNDHPCLIFQSDNWIYLYGRHCPKQHFYKKVNDNMTINKECYTSWYTHHFCSNDLFETLYFNNNKFVQNDHKNHSLTKLAVSLKNAIKYDTVSRLFPQEVLFTFSLIVSMLIITLLSASINMKFEKINVSVIIIPFLYIIMSYNLYNAELFWTNFDKMFNWTCTDSKCSIFRDEVIMNKTARIIFLNVKYYVANIFVLFCMYKTTYLPLKKYYETLNEKVDNSIV